MLELEDMLVMTARRARECGYRIHDGVAALAILYLEEAPPLTVMYPSLERLVEFIKEMNPQNVKLESHIDEDCTLYVRALSDFATHTKH